MIELLQNYFFLFAIHKQNFYEANLVSIAIEKLGKRNVLELTGTMCLKADRRMFQTLE